MKKHEVQIGRLYSAKVSGQIAIVRIEAESPYGGWVARNIQTKREIRIRTAARLRGRCGEPVPMPQREA